MQKVTTLLCTILFAVWPVFASDLTCSVCGMPLSEHAKNRIVMQTETGTRPPLNVCSLSCLKKVKKHDSQYSKIQVVDFNQPDKFISADKAYFLIKSTKIKSDIGENVMPPYFGAFSSSEEAQAAQKKYGEGVIVQGVESALK